jgi:hypothetical protein
VVLCGTGVAVYATNAGHRHAVLIIVRPVSAGTPIRAGDLGEARISADPQVHAVASGQRSSIVGRTPSVNLVPGTLLTRGELANGPLIGPGSAVVGLALKPGRLPSGVKVLDRVSLVQTPNGTSTSGNLPTSAQVLVPAAQVSSVEPTSDGQSTVVSVVVPNDAAPTVAAAAARDEVTLLLLGGAGGP